MIFNFCSQRSKFVFFPELIKTEILSVGCDIRFSPKINISQQKTFTPFDKVSHEELVGMFLGSSDKGSFSTLREE